jgi:hypothetical protein
MLWLAQHFRYHYRFTGEREAYCALGGYLGMANAEVGHWHVGRGANAGACTA